MVLKDTFWKMESIIIELVANFKGNGDGNDDPINLKVRLDNVC